MRLLQRGIWTTTLPQYSLSVNALMDGLFINGNRLTDEATLEIEARVKRQMTMTPDCLGAILVGYDNRIISTYDVADSIDLPLTAHAALKLFRRSDAAAHDIVGARLHQIAVQTPDIAMTVEDFGAGVLIIMSSKAIADVFRAFIES